MFRSFWHRQNTTSTPSHHQTSLECPINDDDNNNNNTTTHPFETSPFLYTLISNLVFYTSAIFLWSIGAISSPMVLLLPLISLPIIRLLMFFTYGETYTNLSQIKLFILNFTYFCFTIFIIPFNLLLLLLFPSSLKFLTSVTLLGLSLDLWRHIITTIFYMFGISYYLSLIFEFFPPVLIPLDVVESNLHVSEALKEIINCVLVLYLNVESYRDGKKFPICKTHEILGLPTWKWIEAFIFVLIIHNFITLFTLLIVWLLKASRDRALSYLLEIRPWYLTLLLEKIVSSKEIVYWANGVKHNVNFVLTLVVILLTWVLYFGSRLNTTPEVERVFDFVTWTFISFLIFGFLWLVKTCVILSWEARSIYNRLGSKIIQTGPQLYFLGVIGRNYKYDIFNVVLDRSLARDKYLDYMWILQPLFQSDSRRQKRLREDLSKGRMERAKDYLLMQETRNSSIYDVRQGALHFLMAQHKLMDNKLASNILHNFRDCGVAQDDKNGTSRKFNIVDIKLLELMDVDSYNNLKLQLREEGYMDSFDLIYYQPFKTWMEKAHTKCLWLANTLRNAKDVTECLGKILSWVLSIVSFIMWLRLTGVATTQELVVIASPLFIVATIIFRDACNTFAKGVMFVYGMHPFDVGDLCVINNDEQMMEVN